jgi:hypothetical protein
MTSGAIYDAVPMNVLRVRYLCHWLLEADAERGTCGVLTLLQDVWLSSSSTLGSAGLRGEIESAWSHMLFTCDKLSNVYQLLLDRK